MPRKLNLAVLLGLIMVSVLSFSLTAGAQEEDMTGEATGAQSEEGVMSEEATKAKETLEQMRKNNEQEAEKYNAANSTLQGLYGDIADTTRNLEAAEANLANSEANLSSQAKEVYKQGNVGFAEVLLDSKNASDFAARLDLMTRIILTERKQVEELRAARDGLAQEEERLEQQLQNHEQTTAEMEERWAKAKEAEAEMKDYSDQLDENILAEIQAEEERRAQAAADKTLSLLATQAEEVAAEPDAGLEEAEQARLIADQIEAEKNAAKQKESQQDAEEEAAEQVRVALQAEEALEQAETQEEEEKARAAAQEAQAAADEAKRKAEEEASRAAAAQQDKEEAIQAAADKQAKKDEIRAAADQQAALMAQQQETQQEAEKDAAEQMIAAKNAREAAQAAKTEQERQQAQAEAQKAEAAAKEQANNAAKAEQAKQDAQKALAEEQKKAQPAGTLAAPPIPGATTQQPDPNQANPNQANPNQANPNQANPNQPAGTPPPAGSASADAVAEGMKWVNVVPYVLGGEDPSGMDCTGFVKWAYRGTKNLPHSIEGQAASGPQVSGEPQAGDILIWPGYHVALVTGPGMMAHASNYHGMVVHVPITDMEPYAYAVRPA